MPGTVNTFSFGNKDAFDSTAGDAYRGFEMESNFHYDPGVFVLPVASDVPKVVVVRVHGGYGTRRVDFTALKNGKPPVIPAAGDTDKDVLVSADLNLPLPGVNPQNSGFDWVVRGSYFYVTADKNYGPRIPGFHAFPAGQYPFPLPIQDAASEYTANDPSSLAAAMHALEGDIIQKDAYNWPFTVFPPQFCNPLMLRED